MIYTTCGQSKIQAPIGQSELFTNHVYQNCRSKDLLAKLNLKSRLSELKQYLKPDIKLNPVQVVGILTRNRTKGNEHKASLNNGVSAIFHFKNVPPAPAIPTAFQYSATKEPREAKQVRLN